MNTPQSTTLIFCAIFLSTVTATSTTTTTTQVPSMDNLISFQHETLWILVVGSILAFVLGFGMGANDVSNAFGTSVGSKVLTLKQAYILATIFETLGAILVGGFVADTIRKGVVDLEMYKDSPKVLLLGQIAILGGCSCWLMIATFSELPVSTTHSVVGATIGFSLSVRGFEGINWWEIGRIALSWFTSPLLSGIVSGILYLIVDFAVLRRSEPLEAGLRVVPFFYFACISFNTFAVVYQGSSVLGLESIPLWLALLISLFVGFASAMIIHYVLKPRLKNWIYRKNTIATIRDTLRRSGTILSHQPSPGVILEKDHITHLDGGYVIDGVSHVTFGYTDIPLGNIEMEKEDEQTPRKISKRVKKISETVVSMDYVPQSFEWTTKGFIKWLLPAKDRKEDKKTIKLFSTIQVFTACFAGFAHGSNDVSNAIAPLTALLAIYNNMSVDQNEGTPIYVLLYGVFAICVGLCLLGHKVIKTVGQKMSEIHAASGFTIEFGAAATVLLASKLGLPISTTHCLVGSVVVVGCIKSGSGVRWSVFRNVALSWFITLPASALISAGIMLLLKFTI